MIIEKEGSFFNSIEEIVAVGKHYGLSVDDYEEPFEMALDIIGAAVDELEEKTQKEADPLEVFARVRELALELQPVDAPE